MRESERSLGVTRYFGFFCKHLQFLHPEMRECKRAAVSYSWNKHWLQMNETVVRFDLVNTWRRATFTGLRSIYENKANPQTKGRIHGSFVISEGEILSFYHRAIYIKVYNPSNKKKRRWEERRWGQSHTVNINRLEKRTIRGTEIGNILKRCDGVNWIQQKWCLITS